MKKYLTIPILMLAATAAEAHTGHVDGGLLSGFMHPLAGWDHLLAMIAVGLWAARLGGRALWSVPASFVAVMVLTALATQYGLVLPAVESGIAASVLVLGLLLTLAVRLPVVPGMVLVAIFALFHGYAHGAEWPLAVAPQAYVAGFVLATLMLHLVGIVLGRIAPAWSPLLSRVAGALITAAGGWLLMTA